MSSDDLPPARQPRHFESLPYWLGFFTGLRAMTGPATVAWAAHSTRLDPQPPFDKFASNASFWFLRAAQALELVGDKLPFTPSRTNPPGLAARIVMGTTSGAALASSARKPVSDGAVAGAVGGLIGTFAGYQARTWLLDRFATRDDGTSKELPRILCAVAEDVVAVTGSLAVVLAAARRSRRD